MNTLLGLAAGQQRYAFFTNANGGVIDDLIIANCGDHFVVGHGANRIAAAYRKFGGHRIGTGSAHVRHVDHFSASSQSMWQQSAHKRTPPYDLHVARGARMGPFAGYEMPIQYPSG